MSGSVKDKVKQLEKDFKSMSFTINQTKDHYWRDKAQRYFYNKYLSNYSRKTMPLIHRFESIYSAIERYKEEMDKI